MKNFKDNSIKFFYLIIILLCTSVSIIIFGIIFNQSKYNGRLKTDEDVVLNLSGRYPGDEFEVLQKDSIELSTKDYKDKTIKTKGYSYKVKSKLTNVEFEISDDIYYGSTGHIADGVVFYIKDTYKESWYMQIAKNVKCDDKIIEIKNNDISFDISKFSSFEEFSEQIYNYKGEIIEGDLYKIIKKKNQYENVHFIIHTENGTTIYIPIYEITSIDELKAYEYLVKYINN